MTDAIGETARTVMLVGWSFIATTWLLLPWLLIWRLHRMMKELQVLRETMQAHELFVRNLGADIRAQISEEPRV